MKKINSFIWELESIEEEEAFMNDVITDASPSRRLNQELAEAAFKDFGFHRLRVVSSLSLDRERHFGKIYLLPCYDMVIIFE